MVIWYYGDHGGDKGEHRPDQKRGKAVYVCETENHRDSKRQRWNERGREKHTE